MTTKAILSFSLIDIVWIFQPVEIKNCGRTGGTLREMLRCPPGWFVYGFRLRKGGSHFGVTQVIMYCGQLKLAQNDTSIIEDESKTTTDWPSWLVPDSAPTRYPVYLLYGLLIILIHCVNWNFASILKINYFWHFVKKYTLKYDICATDIFQQGQCS